MISSNQELKILILCSYYNRPLLVKRTLQSILRADQNYKNWELVFGDDGSKIPGKPIVEQILPNHLSRVKFVETKMSIEEKIQNGIQIGKFANLAIKESNADIGIMLCDDDELSENSLRDLNNYFVQNPKVKYCYSKVKTFNPLLQSSSESTEENKYNIYKEPINPSGKVDATQVAWRLDCCKVDGAWFQETTKLADKPLIKDTDRSFFENLWEKCGYCYPANFVAQHKGIHDHQLLWHKNAGDKSIRDYDRKCRELGGVLF